MGGASVPQPRRRQLALAVTGAAWLCGMASAACDRGDINVLGEKENSLEKELVGYWPMDDKDGTRVTDPWNSKHGELAGPGTWLPDGAGGGFGGALHFEPGAGVSVPNFTQAALNRDWSVGLWVRLPPGNYPDPFLTLISTEIGLKGGWEMNVKLTATEAFYQFGYFKGPTIEYEAYDSLGVPRDVWTHLVAVVDGANKILSFYRNGEFEGSKAISQTFKLGSDTLYMGRWETASDRRLKGDLDDVVVYRRVLTASEVKALTLRPALRPNLMPSQP